MTVQSAAVQAPRPAHKAEIAFDVGAFDRTRIQPVTHTLAQHPLLQLDALRALARRLGPKQVRHHAITAAAGSDFEKAPEQHKVGIGFEEALARIESAGSWIALHNCQSDPLYRALLDEVLDEVARKIGDRDPGMFNRAFWIFIQSPNSVTPYHMDHEQNFLMQIRGKKLARVWHPEDTLTETALEIFHSEFTRREAKYDESLNAKAKVFKLEPGLGAYMPFTAPHLVNNQDNVSITISMTYCTAATRRIETIHRGNAKLRKLGFSPRRVGQSPFVDALKHRAFRAYLDLRARRLGRDPMLPEWAMTY